MRMVLIILFSFFLLWFGGYLWYLNELSRKSQINSQITSQATMQKTDAIVVLTGGKNRLEVAVKLLQEDLGKKLYISGVDEAVTRAELINLLDINEELANCCIESGNEAVDTVGNAIETMAWINKNGIKSVRVVTSLEHMPRAMVEFKRFMPHITLIEYPVGSWRPENINYFKLSLEYSKYIISLLRARASDQIYNDIS